MSFSYIFYVFVGFVLEESVGGAFSPSCGIQNNFGMQDVFEGTLFFCTVYIGSLCARNERMGIRKESIAQNADGPAWRTLHCNKLINSYFDPPCFIYEEELTSIQDFLVEWNTLI